MRSQSFGNLKLPKAAEDVVAAFHRETKQLADETIRFVPQVIDVVREELAGNNWSLAIGPRRTGGIVLSKSPGVETKCDGWHPEGVAFWVETGRSWTNNAFLQHMCEASLAEEVSCAVIAVREVSSGVEAFTKCSQFASALWREPRIQFGYDSLLLIGF